MYYCVCVCVCATVDLQQQLTTYVSWVNAQLKKKPGLKPITNLRLDLQDGVVLTQLIEIVGEDTHTHTLLTPGVYSLTPVSP